ncbi:A/G-specific adenine glycosylase [Aliidiomarina indica]|uniref:A/G-specific adenine glycosylase n=1 Tax=Aliidiomarina indica TaxID=2749147 RepID=UPI00188E134B|nr:A/G-specific adenine glycosylase [Aliidiomarina indica]
MIQPKNFVATVLSWQAAHGRHQLPWQHPATPYRVLVSEIMLQQTQVATVIPYFERWMARFPTLTRLAEASEDEVMSLWQGLGYYSRARNLRKAAKYLVQENHGEFPRELSDIQSIPGVGRYTAGAIKSFAYDEYGPIVDGNVRRLFCRLFGVEGVPNTSKVDKQLWALAERYTPTENNRRFAQGLLDLGATLCTARNPNCQQCPFAEHCVALRTDMVDQLPTPKPKKVIPQRIGHFLWIQKQTDIYLEKRPAHGIWASLWSLPELTEAPFNATLKGQFQHTFSHYKLDAKIWTVNEPPTHELREATAEQWVSLDSLSDIGLPAPIRKYIEHQKA